MNNKQALLAGVLAGLASPGSIFAAPSYPTLQGSDLERMRQSASRVGNDFRKVMTIEYGKTATDKPKG